MSKSRNTQSYFLLFLLFNLCFLGLQLGYIYTQAGNFTRLIPLPWTVYYELVATLAVQIGLYVVCSGLQTFLLLGILKRPWYYFSIEQWQIIIWTLSIGAILAANAYYFPLSLFSKLLSPPLGETSALGVLTLSLTGISLLLLNSLLYRKSLILLALGIPVFYALNSIRFIQPNQSQLAQTKPNVIILGIDSLTPESIQQSTMPFVTHLLQNSTQFTNAISPLARTYPAWSSILTGLYVKHHHAEENLVAKQTVNSKASIAWLLKKQGYETIYATDDRRFNSIDTDFGFQHIIGPKLGVNDVILGSYNDFPLSNLLINFKLSSWPFPYNYTNRASFFSYYPETFAALLQTKLQQLGTNKPLFLAVHFTLPHWPYAWAESLPEQVNNEFSLEKREFLYQSALQKVDQQFSAFYNFLQQQGYFQNSLVIVLSDHGEALYYANSRLTNYHNYQGTRPSPLAEYFKNKTATVLNKSAGHGSDILSPRQYRSMLTFEIFQNGQLITHPGQIKTRVALIDLAPTILSFIGLPIPAKTDGISLLTALFKPSISLPDRTFYIESGMFPNQEFSAQKAMAIGKAFYKINPHSEELELNAKGLKRITDQKLYGIIAGDWVLALYPNDQHYIAVIQNLVTGKWSDDLHSEFARSTPVDKMLVKLQRFYAGKLCCTL